MYVWTEVVHSLAVEVRRQSNQVRWLMRTPLLEQRPKKTNVIAVSMAALVESFYRSGLNAAMNARLSGQWGALFPNMHIQCPARIMYINGFKGLRQYLDWKVKPDDYSNPTAARLCMSFAPGIIMTPLSSMLEASNAGHMNPEPITSRWMRGITWRMCREVIFGIGLNQLSDYMEERIPQSITTNEALRTAGGSMIAGLLPATHHDQCSLLPATHPSLPCFPLNLNSVWVCVDVERVSVCVHSQRVSRH